MNILITGAAGFIGSHLARTLIWQSHTVIGLDNFNDYYPRKCKEFNVDLIRLAAKQSSTSFPLETLAPVYTKLEEYYKKDNPNSNPQDSSAPIDSNNFHFYEADITNLEALQKIFISHSQNNNQIDAIVHLAAMAGVPMSTKKPLLYSKVNVEGTMNLLTLASQHQSQNQKSIKFLFASSSSVYGHRQAHNFVVTETDDVTKARSVYGATKVAGEVLCHSFHKSKNLNCAIIRIFGPIFGPLQRPYGMLHQRAINYTHNNKTLTIFGLHGLDTKKDATYIDDEVNGIIKILNSNFNFEIYNIGTQNALPIQHWLGCIQNAFNQQEANSKQQENHQISNKQHSKQLNIQIIEADKADVTSSANISKAKLQLGYNPKTTMQEGINRQVEIFNLMPNWYQEMQNV